MRTRRLSTAMPRYAADALSDVVPGKPWYERYSQRRLLGDTAYRRLKRLMDVGGCLVALPVAIPLLGLCAIAIKAESAGPVFFIQQRAGKGGDSFKVYKLRTMVINAEELKEKYLHLNELKPPDFKIENDPRVTHVGRFLRKTSLDELPQIFNVLRGDMSLVGPRPSSYGAMAYSLWHTARFELQPGITGLAQVCGRSELCLDDKLRYDIAYLRNQSLWLDVQILLRTAVVVFRGRGVK